MEIYEILNDTLQEGSKKAIILLIGVSEKKMEIRKLPYKEKNSWN